MEKKTLKLAQFFNLNAELNGFENPETKEKVLDGILSQKISLKTKYWLTDLSKKVKEQVDSCESLKNDLINKYGEANDKGVFISYTVKDKDGKEVVNENFKLFQEEYNSLMNEDREIEYKQLSIDDFGNIETTDTYDILFSLLK